jgi:hypothetical protein
VRDEVQFEVGAAQGSKSSRGTSSPTLPSGGFAS